MAEQQPQHQASLQHLAHLHQDLVARQGASVLQHQPQVALAEAGLEAHLQQQAALVTVQDLERQRLRPQHSEANPPDQLRASQHYKGI